MPGQPLDIDLPLQSDNVSDAMAKISDSLQVIETDLEAKVVAAEIDINGNLDFNGWALIGATAVTLELVADPDDYGAGSAVYSGGEWYLVTADGSIRVTLDGALDATGIGGIVGDYGGVNPAAVTYVDSSGVYQFTEAPGVWADVEVDDVILHGTAGTVRLACHSSVDSAPTLSFCEPPAAAIELLLVDSGGKVYPGGGESIAGAYTFSGVQTYNNDSNHNAIVNVNGVLSVDGDVQIEGGLGATIYIDSCTLQLLGTADISRQKDYETVILPNIGMREDIDSVSIGSNQNSGVVLAAAQNLRVPFPMLVGEAVRTCKLVLACAGGTDTMQIDIGYVTSAGAYNSLFSATQAVNTTLQAYSLNITDHTMAAGEALFVRITTPATQSGSIGPVSIIHDRPSA